ncbi:Rne/Rng family ribonuclease [Paracrocinitomix mangrovi]|uniref:Rne/Rng family ribonuclease n=1 Tax=Paracrocinitomix mangrovi TaxID=2862509 RepID=UPI001C8DB754|nr:Rne/Rng family ribonuclease [Paracrocinitomix mangrovi]UKN03821.1 Rne/Rng family ribonuclease [Paracrocinitomix mangrovi]
MSYELVVNSKPTGIWIALLRDGKLLELHEEKGNTDYAVGDIYLGKVRKVVPSLNAAFVNVGYEKDAFLHYHDLGPQFKSLHKFTQDTLHGKQNVADLLYFKSEKDIDKDGKISDVLSANTNVLVQVVKEPISAKGPRLNSEITLAGRYIVLVPFSNKISISQKIKDYAERDRLRDILKSILPKNFGVIIRTVAQGKKIVEIDEDLKSLVSRWKKMHTSLKDSKPPKRVLGELDRASSLLRDTLNENFTKIHVNEPELLDEMRNYVEQIAPNKINILKEYNGKHDIFEAFGINKQIKTLFGKKVPLPSGGYLIIEHTEAMHVVDVNSGNRSAKNDTQEKNAIAVNLEAAEELARVMRLRDMGGIICVDFIDMHSRENNKMLHNKLKDLLKEDKAKHSLIPPSKFGVVEITRQRVRPVTNIETTEVCPTCNGTGKIQASLMYADEIESELSYLLLDKKESKVSLHVHPYLEGYFKKGMNSRRFQWFKKYKKWIKIVADSNMPIMDHKFFNAKDEIIEV